MRSKAILMALLALAFGGVEAVPVTQNQAAAAARALVSGAVAFKARLGTSVEKVAAQSTAKGAVFYAVKMKEGGTVFLSGDTEDQPVICFTADAADYSAIDRRSPLWALLARDLAARQAQRPRTAQAATASWARLCRAGGAGDVAKPLTAAAQEDFPGAELGGDLRVAALVKSQWAQDGWDGTYDGELDGDPAKCCYSYYTPVLSDGRRAVCGCVATAMAQVMRYHEYPEAAAKVQKPCYVEPRYEMNEFTGNEEFVGATNLTVSGESFDWANMTLRPKDDGASEDVCKAIGRLTSDAGVAACMCYDTLEKGGSGSFLLNAATALRDVFKYKSAAFYTAGQITDDAEAFHNSMFANFDAGCPVLLGITGGGGHAIVADGYGFITEGDKALPYVHLNMGWAGECDFWYNLPDMREAGFTVVDEVVFNIFPEKDGSTAIVSGRVLDDGGRPVSGVAVKLLKAGTSVLAAEAVTSASGVYAATVPANVSYDIEAAAAPLVGEKANVAAVYTTVQNGTVSGLLYDDGVHEMQVRTFSGLQATKVGNSWGNDVTVSGPAVRVTTTQGDEVFCTTLVKAMWAAGDLSETLPEGETIDIEIVKPVTLEQDWKINYDCTIHAASADPSSLAVPCAGEAKIVVVEGARVLFSNVVFTASAAALRVEDAGTAALAGKVGLDEIGIAAAGRLEIAGELDTGYSHRVRQDGETTVGTVFGGASVELAAAQACANLFVNAVNEELVGVASDVGGAVQLAWGIGDIPDSAAVVRLVQDGASVNFQSLASALKFVTNDAEVVVLKDCPLATEIVIEGKTLTVSSETGAVILPSESQSESASITVGGGELVLSNVVFRGFTQLGANGVFVKVRDGGALRMLDGAGLEGIDNAYGTYGAVKVESGGVVEMKDGSYIRDCHSEKYGGAVYLAAKASLTLAGGSITDCSAPTGGGVYVTKGGTVSVSGASKVEGNTQGASAERSNVYFAGSTVETCPLTVLDGLEGAAIGVRYRDEARAELEGELAVFGDGVTGGEQAALAFVNDVHPDGQYAGYAAAVAEDGTGLVWGPARAEPGEVPEAEAKVVVDRAGKTLYFADLAAAFASLTGGVASVTLKDDVMLDKDDGDCAVVGEVTLDGAGHRIGRGNDSRLLVSGAGDSLTFANVTMTGTDLSGMKGGNRSVVRVEDGGLFVMDGGAVIRDVTGASETLRTTAAVSIWNAEFVMRDGAEIRDCENDCAFGAGGGVIVAGESSIFRFEGGSIRNCKVPDGTGAGVQIDNKAAFIVSGRGTIEGNVGRGGVESNVYVSDLSNLQLADEFTGSIGYSEGIKGDTNVFGRVAEECPKTVGELAASAANFFQDGASSVTGCIVTNDATALLVWRSALVTDEETGEQYYEDDEGVRYGLVEGGEPPAPVEPDPIAFESITRLSDTEWKLVVTNVVPFCSYRLIWTKDLTKGFTTTGEWVQAAADAPAAWTNDVVTEGGAWFWKAEGKGGTAK